jgi:TPR repeat protein
VSIAIAKPITIPIKKQLLALILLAIFYSGDGFAAPDYQQTRQQFDNGEYTLSFPRLLALAKLGNASAQLTLAESYALGLGTEKHIEQAYAWTLMAMDHQHRDAKAHYLQYRRLANSKRHAKALYRALAKDYGINTLNQQLYPLTHQGNGLNNLNETAVPVHMPAPQYPDGLSQNNPGGWAIVEYDINPRGETDHVQLLAAYTSGTASTMGPTSLETVKNWRFKPSEQLHQTQWRLFQLPGAARDDHFAHLNQLRNSAMAGNATDQYLLAALVEVGLINANSKPYKATNSAIKIGTPLQWLLTSAINGYDKAQYALYRCLSKGGLCQPDNNKSLKWLNLASEQGNINARYFLAKAYATRNNGLVAYAPEAAIPLLTGLINANHLPAMILYTRLLAHNSNRRLMDPQKAIKYGQQAMALDHNHPDLLLNIGIASFELDQFDKGQDFLLRAINEAELRQWPVTDYVNVLDGYQRKILVDK